MTEEKEWRKNGSRVDKLAPRLTASYDKYGRDKKSDTNYMRCWERKKFKGIGQWLSAEFATTRTRILIPVGARCEYDLLTLILAALQKSKWWSAPC